MNSFSVERFMVYRGRRLYGFRVEGYSKPGVIAALSAIIAEKGLDITYYSTIGTVKLGERGGGIFFIDFTESDVKPEELAREFMALDFVDKVEIIRPRFEGFIADDVSFPLMLGGGRAIIFSEPALRGFLLDFRRRLGTGGEAMLYYIGREVGAEWARNVNHITERIGVKSLRDKFSIGGMTFKSLGYGIPEMLEYEEHPPFLRVKIHRCIECELAPTRGGGRTNPIATSSEA